MYKNFALISSIIVIALCLFVLIKNRVTAGTLEGKYKTASIDFAQSERAFLNKKVRFMVNRTTAVLYLIGAIVATVISKIMIGLVCNVKRNALSFMPDKKKATRVTSGGAVIIALLLNGIMLLALVLIYWGLSLNSIHNSAIGIAFGVSTVALFGMVGGDLYTRLQDAGESYI